MAWIFVATSAIIMLNILAAPVPKLDANDSSVMNSLELHANNSDADSTSVIDPLLVQKTSQKFANIFKYALEMCRSFTPHQEIELRKGILMMTEDLEDFPETKDMDRMVLEATAATIARNVVEYATEDGGIFDKMSCVEQALKMAFQLTTGTPDHYFISEVQRMIEVFYLQVHQSGDSLQSYEGSYSRNYDSFGDEDYVKYFTSPEYYEVYGSAGFYEYPGEMEYFEYPGEMRYFEFPGEMEYSEDMEPYLDDDFQSPGEIRYFEFPGEMEYSEDMEPYLDDDFQSDEYEPYYEPQLFELVPVEYAVREIPEEFWI